MIAVSFLDAIDCNDRIDAGQEQTNAMRHLVNIYVASALADFDRVLECEQQFGAMAFPSPAKQSKANRSLYQVYQNWAADAEQVLLRGRRIANSPAAIANIEALEDSMGRVQARLKMTPEMFDRARQQVRHGEGIPMQELRNEFRARVRS